MKLNLSRENKRNNLDLLPMEGIGSMKSLRFLLMVKRRGLQHVPKQLDTKVKKINKLIKP